jgi:hypothetical protein
LHANAGTGICHISDGARAHAALLAEEQQRVLDYFRSADLRSFISITRVLNEPLVDPAAAVMPPPDFSANELAANGPSWNDDCPKMPDLRPRWFRLLAPYLELII